MALNNPFNDIPVRRDEQGYILITAVWMLLLGASIVAFLMLKNLHAGENFKFDHEMLQTRYAQESAIETVVADILFNGPRSEFTLLPAQSRYSINDRQIVVKVSSESGKIDVNQADPELLERALRGLGISAFPRQAFLEKVKNQRDAKRSYQSVADVEGAMQQAGFDLGGDFCAGRYFTVYTGLGQPQPSQMDPKLAKALGQAALESNVRASPGTPIRIEAKAGQGASVVAVVRTSGLIGQSHSVLDWSSQGGCL